ncbi:ribonuclease H-like domain-containing protein [Synechococcus sp. CS-1326]|nr:ribonuclease H-like domain-containing protein [Synechococcus sp. CS-1326]
MKSTSAGKEALLWQQGILTWDDLSKIKSIQGSFFSSADSDSLRLAKAEHALRSTDERFFTDLLPKSEHFRIPHSFPDKTLFVDIETTGLSRYYDHITMVGWACQGEYSIYVEGHSDKILRKALADARSVVTFNGSHFDLPFLKQTFKDLQIPSAHIDLRFLAKRVGLSGGQKAIEEVLGFHRQGQAAEIRGEGAPVLWHRYRRGDVDAMRLLVEYNKFDIEGMFAIFDYTVGELLEKRQVPPAIQQEFPSFAGKIEAHISTEHIPQPNRQGITIYVPKYEGIVRPLIDYQTLLDHCNSIEPSIVGIGLTGSELKPSGWCFLSKGIAKTMCIKTDNELVKKTLEANPTLVSIDSPLSLPTGRQTAFDDGSRQG